MDPDPFSPSSPRRPPPGLVPQPPCLCPRADHLPHPRGSPLLSFTVSSPCLAACHCPGPLAHGLFLARMLFPNPSSVRSQVLREALSFPSTHTSVFYSPPHSYSNTYCYSEDPEPLCRTPWRAQGEPKNSINTCKRKRTQKNLIHPESLQLQELSPPTSQVCCLSSQAGS
jgi:hypothetical protein